MMTTMVVSDTQLLEFLIELGLVGLFRSPLFLL